MKFQKKEASSKGDEASLLRFCSFIRGKGEKDLSDDYDDDENGGKLDRDRIIYMT